MSFQGFRIRCLRDPVRSSRQAEHSVYRQYRRPASGGALRLSGHDHRRRLARFAPGRTSHREGRTRAARLFRHARKRRARAGYRGPVARILIVIQILWAISYCFATMSKTFSNKRQW